MIPKKIHYCWFGKGEKPKIVKNCIESWQKRLPDYEIIEWNESNFDLMNNQYVREAYKEKKYAFVTDFARLYILYHHGGIYMDTDVEVLKPIDKFLEHKAFTGCESENMCVTGIIGAVKYHPWIQELLAYYDNRPFILEDGKIDTTTNTKIITELTINKYCWERKDEYQKLNHDINIYPFDFFCCKEFDTGKIVITENTYTIHHFSGSWHTLKDKVWHRFIKFLGPKIVKKLQKIKYRLINKG